MQSIIDGELFPLSASKAVSFANSMYNQDWALGNTASHEAEGFQTGRVRPSFCVSVRSINTIMGVFSFSYSIVLSVAETSRTRFCPVLSLSGCARSSPLCLSSYVTSSSRPPVCGARSRALARSTRHHTAGCAEGEAGCRARSGAGKTSCGRNISASARGRPFCKALVTSVSPK